MIGLLQYDFIAGIFGYQASVFSRLIYIVFGLASIILLFKLIKGRGSIAVFSRRNKKDLKENIDKISQKQPAHANIEGAREDYPQSDFDRRPPRQDFDEYRDDRQEGLFDEHLGER